MKLLALVAFLTLGLSATGQEVPPFLKGYEYDITTVLAANGIPFEAFEVSDFEQAKALQRDIKQLRRRHRFWIEKNGLRVTHRVIGDWTVMTFTGVDFRRVNIFVE